METRILKIEDLESNQLELKLAADTLAEGKLVVFPTETVYGLGANALDQNAVKRIFEAKGRPSDNPLIVHISQIEQLTSLVKSIPPKAQTLMDAFWPGPLTLVFFKSESVSNEVTAGLTTVAIRMPDNEIALRIISLSGVPIAAPSANLSGRPSPTEAIHVIEDLFGRVDIIVDGGSCSVGLESTVLDITVDPPVVLRPGGITAEMLEEVIGPVIGDKPSEISVNDTPKSPGMKYRHYAPKAEMTIVSGDSDRVVCEVNRLVKKCREGNLKVGVLASRETCKRYDAQVVLSPGSRERLEDVAGEIYACLRSFDDAGVDVIYAEAFSEEGIGHAIMNRLRKAAAGRMIEV